MDATRHADRRRVLTQRLIDASPVPIAVRRGAVDLGTYTLGVAKGAARLARPFQSEASGEARGYVTFCSADEALDIRRGDRLRDPQGQVYLVVLIPPNRNGRTDIECVVEQ